MQQSLPPQGQGPTKDRVNQCLKMDIFWSQQNEYVCMHIVFWEVTEGSQMWQAVNLGLRFGEANKKKHKLEVMFRVLGFAQICIDFEKSFIIVLNVGVYLSFLVYSHGHCMLLSHGSQAMQTSRFSTARVPMDTCGMSYIKRFWKCSL